MYRCHERYGKHILFFAGGSRVLGKLVDDALGNYIRYGPNRLLFNTNTALNSEYLGSAVVG